MRAEARGYAVMESTPQVAICGVWRVTGASVAPRLPRDVAHLWEQPLNEWQALDRCAELLSAEERTKASQYRVERPRRQFILTRGTLRLLLGSYLEKDPAELNFRYTEYGKPFLEESGDLRFNVSHSDGMALLAFVRGREIGVDIEKISTTRDVQHLAQRFFSARERDNLARLSGKELQQAFFRCWTRKEAYIKAMGEGLSLPLDQFDVSVLPHEANALLATRPDPSEARRWQLSEVPSNPEYAAAVAVELAVES